MSNKEILLSAAKALGLPHLAPDTPAMQRPFGHEVFDPFGRADHLLALQSRLHISVIYSGDLVSATCQGVGHFERLPGGADGDQAALVNAIVWCAALMGAKE